MIISFLTMIDIVFYHIKLYTLPSADLAKINIWILNLKQKKKKKKVERMM